MSRHWHTCLAAGAQGLHDLNVAADRVDADALSPCAAAAADARQRGQAERDVARDLGASRAASPLRRQGRLVRARARAQPLVPHHRVPRLELQGRHQRQALRRRLRGRHRAPDVPAPELAVAHACLLRPLVPGRWRELTRWRHAVARRNRQLRGLARLEARQHVLVRGGADRQRGLHAVLARSGFQRHARYRSRPVPLGRERHHRGGGRRVPALGLGHRRSRRGHRRCAACRPRQLWRRLGRKWRGRRHTRWCRVDLDDSRRCLVVGQRGSHWCCRLTYGPRGFELRRAIGRQQCWLDSTALVVADL